MYVRKQLSHNATARDYKASAIGTYHSGVYVCMYNRYPYRALSECVCMHVCMYVCRLGFANSAIFGLWGLLHSYLGFVSIHY